MSTDVQGPELGTVVRPTSLFDALRAITANLTLPDLHGAIAVAAARCAQSESAALYAQDGALYRCVALSTGGEPDPRLGDLLPVLEHWLPLRQMQAEGRPVFIEDTWLEPFWPDLMPSTPGAELVRSWLGLPIMLDGRLLAFLGLGYRRIVHLSDPEQSDLAQFATATAPVLRNAGLLAESGRAAHRATTRLELTARLRPAVDPEAIPRLAVEALGPILGASLCAIHPRGGGGSRSPVTWMSGEVPLDPPAELVIRSTIEAALGQKRMIAAVAVAADPCPEETIRVHRETLLQCGVHGLAVAPIFQAGEPLGALVCTSQTPSWDASDVLLVEQVAADLGWELARAATLHDLRAEAARLDADLGALETALGVARATLRDGSDLQDLGHTILEALAQVVPCEAGLIVTLVTPGPGWEPQAGTGTALEPLIPALEERARRSSEPIILDARALHEEDEAGEALREARLQACLALPVGVAGRESAAMILLGREQGPFADYEAARAAHFALILSLGLRREQLLDEARTGAVREDRDRLAREVHNVLAQTITSLVMQIDALAGAVGEDSPFHERVEQMRGMGRAAAAETRRLVWNLRPVSVDLQQPRAVVEEEAGRFERRAGIRPRVSVVGDDKTVAAEIGAVVQRLTQVALENVTRHSGATQVQILLHYGMHGLDVHIEDDGRGFDPETINLAAGRLGLSGVSERARQVGGSLRIESAAGNGTRVLLRIPFAPAEPLPRQRPAREERLVESTVTGVPGAPVRIVLIDDHAMVREGLVRMLAEQSDFQIVEAVSNGTEGLRAIVDHKPDVVLCDLQLPDIPGVEVIDRARTHFPDIRCLVVTTFDDEELIYEAIKAGAKGYVLKDASSEELVEAVRAVARNESLLQPIIAHKLVERFGALARQGDMVEALTEREVEVLRALASGLRNKEIAFQLGLSESTIKTHLASVFGKLGVTTRTEAVSRGRELGLIPL